MNPVFSIIIPVFEGQDYIQRALDSIYSQGLSEDQFEVICVDDCSPTLDAYHTITNYTYNGIHHPNLIVVRHDVNKRQGGGRNTGIRSASGDYIIFLDQDDSLVEQCLVRLLNSDEFGTNEDLIMLCHRTQNLKRNTLVKGVFIDSDINKTVMSGCDYICKNPIGWAPWCYIYRREYLIKNGIFFEEGVRWEDLDFVMKAILNANRMSFIPIETYHYYIADHNTSIMGNDKKRIEDWMKMSIRVKNVAESFLYRHKDASMMVINHHIHHYEMTLKSVLWRLPYREIVYLLRTYPPYGDSNNKWLNWVIKRPRSYASIASVVRPFLLIGLWVRNRLFD